MAFVVNRKVGKAVVRNRVRRRLREAMRHMLSTGDGAAPLTSAEPTVPAVQGSGPGGRWPASFEALVIVRPSAAEAGYQELADGLRLALDRASATERAGHEGAPSQGRRATKREPRP